MSQNGRNIREKILALLRVDDYRPLDRIEIARKLGLKSNQQVALRKALRELEHSGEIVRIRKNCYVLPAEADLITGKLSLHQVGYGFLSPETAGPPDNCFAAGKTPTAARGPRVGARGA